MGRTNLERHCLQWKVEDSKVSEMLNCSFIVSACRLLGSRETTQKDQLFVFSQGSRSLEHRTGPSFIHRDNTFVPTLIISQFRAIRTILRCSCNPKIIPTIVEGVAILMIAALFHSTAKNYSVHPYSRLAYFACAFCIKTLGAFIPISKPVEFGQPLKISGIHDGILPFCERNKPIIGIERLLNLVTLHGAFHRSTSNGSLNFSRYFSI